MHDAHGPEQVYILPSHEHLSSTLRIIHTPRLPPHKVHASFAWLGHGTMLVRSLAANFLALTSQLNFTEDEMKMADNYYAILANKVPEIWFDQGIELGGGTPFTVGDAGTERNNLHITRATQYLEQLVSCHGEGCQAWSYVDLDKARRPSGERGQHIFSAATRLVSRAACRGRPCVLETNIRLLPHEPLQIMESAADVIQLEKYNTEMMGKAAVDHYIQSPPSLIVDGSSRKAFRTFGGVYRC
jgi:hypothetical protein